MKGRLLFVLLYACSLSLSKSTFSQISRTSGSIRAIVRQNVNPNDLGHYLDEAAWDSLFPHRYGYQAKNDVHRQEDYYSLHSFMVAAGMFPGFLSEGNTEVRKRELAAFLASIAYETGGGWVGAPDGACRWGLYFKEEKSKAGTGSQYIDSSKAIYPPFPGVSYHGRGPIQLSWNYNYGQFSEAWFGNKDSLLRNPGLLSEDAVISFASAIWFWMTPQFPKPSCHDVIVGNWKPNNMDSTKGRLPGFGAVVNVINGGVECGSLTEDERTTSRYRYYQYYCDYLQITPGENRQCGFQTPFGQ